MACANTSTPPPLVTTRHRPRGDAWLIISRLLLHCDARKNRARSPPRKKACLHYINIFVGGKGGRVKTKRIIRERQTHPVWSESVVGQSLRPHLPQEVEVAVHDLHTDTGTCPPRSGAEQDERPRSRTIQHSLGTKKNAQRAMQNLQDRPHARKKNVSWTKTKKTFRGIILLLALRTSQNIPPTRQKQLKSARSFLLDIYRSSSCLRDITRCVGCEVEILGEGRLQQRTSRYMPENLLHGN